MKGMKLSVVLLFMILPVLSGCNEKKETEKWIVTLSQKLQAVRLEAGDVPYRQEQHLALRNYFSEVAKGVLVLKQEPKKAEAFNSVFRKLEADAVCSRTLISSSEWRQIAGNCVRNRFFICSDEVRAYPELLVALTDQLTADNRRRFDDSPTCRAALEMLKE